MDASLVFHSMHSPAVLAKRKPAGTYVMPERDALDRDFVALGAGFEAEGTLSHHMHIVLSAASSQSWCKISLAAALVDLPFMGAYRAAALSMNIGVLLYMS